MSGARSFWRCHVAKLFPVEFKAAVTSRWLTSLSLVRRYLRLSQNNIRTLLKLCRDAGLDVDIHPHMVEGEIDAKKVFAQNPSVAL